MAIPSAWGIAAATMLFVSGVLFCIGFSTPNWTLRRQGQNLEGLWQDCFDRVYDASTHIYTSGCASNTGDHADWLDATRAMIVLGLICLILAMFICILSLCTSESSRLFYIIQIGLLFASGFFSTIGLIVYGGKYDRETEPEKSLGYSFALATIGDLGALAAGVLSVIEMLRMKKD